MKSLITTSLWLMCLHCNTLFSQDANPRPLMKDFIGINTRSSDDIRFIQKFDFVRTYHEWSDDAGFDLDGIPNCPHNLLSFNPSNSEAAIIDLDGFYRQLSGRVSPVMKWLAPEMRGLTHYDPVLLEQKPVCGDLSAIDQQTPETYFDYARWVSITAARYGANNVCADPENPLCGLLNSTVIDGDVVGASVAGLGNLRYLELGNEPDKWWHDGALRNTPNALWQMMPQQYAALLHAAYDGGGKSDAFRLSPSHPDFLGVKNIDNQIQVAMAGLSDFRGRYIIEMLEKAYSLRASNPNAVKKIPFDILNLHHYTSNNPNNGAAYIDNNALWNTYDYFGLNSDGASPEQCQLKKRYERFFERLFAGISNNAIKAELAGPGMKFWLSEFGYDTNNNSPTKAKLAQNSQSYFTTQAQWLVRAYLELSAVEYNYAGEKIVLDKVAAFDLRDAAPQGESSQYSAGGWLFSHSGLLTRDFQPKRSWYFVQTLKNVLGNTVFTKDLNPDGSILFDNGGTPPRIYYYKGADGTRALAVWSPTSANVSGRYLTLSINDLAAKTGDPELLNTAAYTVVRMQDNSERGFRQGYDVQGGQLKFDTGSMPVSETPIFVLLGEKTSDPTVICPINGSPVVTASCNAALLEWEANTSPSGHWKVFFAQKSKLPDYPSCSDYKNADLLGNGFVHTVTHDLKGDRKRLFVEGLNPNTGYVAFMAYVNPDGIAAQEPCVVCFSTNNNPPAPINPCLTVEASEPCNSVGDDFCKLVIANTGAAQNTNCPNAASACISGNPQVVVNCNTYNAGDCGAAALYPKNQLWADCDRPEVIVAFENQVRLDAIKFFHHSGISHVEICYSTCDNPDERQYLTTFKPSGCNQWVSLFDNLPAQPVKKLYFQKIAARGKGSPAEVIIGKLHFYGKEMADCDEQIQVRESFSEPAPPPALRISPNPVSGPCKLTWGQPGYEQLLVFNSRGVLLRRFALHETALSFECDLGDLPAGSYFIRLTGAQKSPVQQILEVLGR